MASANNSEVSFSEVQYYRTFIREQGYYCNLCGECSPSEIDWEYHYSVVHKRILQNIKECPYKLRNCFYRTFYFCSLVTHVQTFHKRSIVIFTSCDICEKIYFSQTEWIIHARYVHSTISGSFMSILYKCEKCDPPTLYSTMFNLLKHYRETHISYTCFMCDTVFPTQLKFHDHFSIHTKPEKSLHPYRCQICNEKTACRSALDIHYVNVHQHWPYDCRMCNTRFRLESEFYQHYETRHKVPEPGIYYYGDWRYSDDYLAWILMQDLMERRPNPFLRDLCRIQ